MLLQHLKGEVSCVAGPSRSPFHGRPAPAVTQAAAWPRRNLTAEDVLGFDGSHRNSVDVATSTPTARSLVSRGRAGRARGTGGPRRRRQHRRQRNRRRTGEAYGELREKGRRQGRTAAHEEGVGDVVRLGEDAGDGEEADVDGDADGDEAEGVTRALPEMLQTSRRARVNRISTTVAQRCSIGVTRPRPWRSERRRWGLRRIGIDG